MASESTPILILVSVIAGGIGGALGSSFGDNPEAAPQTSLTAEAPTALEDPRVNRLSTDLAQLQIDLDVMRSEMAKASQARSEAPIAATTTAPTPASNAAFGGDIDAAVNAVLEQREAAKKQEEDARDAERRAQRSQRQVDRWKEELGLTDAQAHDMGLILAAQEDKTRDMMREMRDSGVVDRDTMREMWTEMRESTNTALSGILTTDQMSQYEDSSSRGGWGSWGRGGSDRGGRGGGRGGNEPF
ncbi:MAG: hypothetical protein MK213_01710 [Planctomycetes bacterium]|nr:hypothetical protein [Planctomycetota bacterium]